MTILRRGIRAFLLLGPLLAALGAPADLPEGLPPGTDLLPPDALSAAAVNVPDAHGTGSLVRDENGTLVLDVRITRQTENPWGVGLSWVVDAPIAAGSGLLLRFEARAIGDEANAEGQIRTVFRRTQKPYRQALSETVSVGPDWEPVVFALSPTTALAASESTALIHLGMRPQHLQLRAVRLVDYGPAVQPSALAQIPGVRNAAAKGIVGAPLSPLNLATMGALPANFPEPAPDGRSVYAIWTCHGYLDRTNKHVGHVVIRPETTGGKTILVVEQVLALDRGVIHTVRARIVCGDGPLAPPLEWTVESTFRNPDGPIPELTDSETGHTEPGFVTVRSGERTRRAPVPGALTADWALFHAASAWRKAPPRLPLRFDLLEGMTLLKPGWVLAAAEDTQARVAGNRTVPLQVYKLYGSGALPYEIYLAEDGPPVLVVTHSRAYVLDARAEEKTQAYARDQAKAFRREADANREEEEQ